MEAPSIRLAIGLLSSYSSTILRSVALRLQEGVLDKTWTYLGTVANANCPGVRDALHAGHFETAQPTRKEIIAKAQRLFISTDCGQTPPR